MSVAIWSGALLAWDSELSALKSRMAVVFGRAELRQSASAFIDGLLSGVARKTGWLLAERAGLAAAFLARLSATLRCAADSKPNERSPTGPSRQAPIAA